MTSGFAHAEKTTGFAKRIGAKFTPVSFGRTGLSISPFGFGSYRVTQFDSDHREALRTAIRGGVNLIDTSTNYTDGGSERMIGEVLAELFEKKEIDREEIVIVSKVGYVQGENLKEARQLKADGRGYPDMVELEKEAWHNISPEFLEAQITKSLERLKVETLDVLLLHNPEYFLKSVQNRPQYEARIKKAFAHLETEVERKRIRWYGISSNTFIEPETNREFTSVDRAWALASEVKKTHHFAVIQFPMNLFESGAAIVPNNGGKTVLAKAQEYNLGTLANRPFNAFHRGRLIRLTSYPSHDQVDIKGRLHQTLSLIIELEKRIPDSRLKTNLQWGHLLRDKLSDLSDLLTWREFVRQQILPQTQMALMRLSGSHQVWNDEYKKALGDLISLITGTLEGLANERAELIAGQIRQRAPDLTGADTLSRQALRIYLGLPGVNCVLIGMRQVSYVQDILGAPIAPVPSDQALAVMREMPKLP